MSGKTCGHVECHGHECASCGTTPCCEHLETCDALATEATRVWRTAMAHPVGTVGVVEGRTAVLIGADDGARRWQFLNGDWTAIPLGEVETFGHVLDLVTGPTSDRGEESCAHPDTHVWRNGDGFAVCLGCGEEWDESPTADGGDES